MGAYHNTVDNHKSLVRVLYDIYYTNLKPKGPTIPLVPALIPAKGRATYIGPWP